MYIMYLLAPAALAHSAPHSFNPQRDTHRNKSTAHPLSLSGSNLLYAFATSRQNRPQLLKILANKNSFLPADPTASTRNHATQQTISGTIRDRTGPLPGVTITLKNQPQSAISAFDGTFSITASSSDTLVFSFIGYKTQVIPVASRTIINITMLEDATTLREVTVNAGYYTVKDRERTGSIAKVTAKDIEKQPVSNVLAALQGRMAGVAITQTTGVPGGGFNIQVRGRNSIRPDGSAPLYIIDGMPYPSENLGSAFLSGSIVAGGFSPLNGISPSDVETIEILKDADATSIYGSRGANGVVLITTKKGKAGKTAFSVNAYTGTAKVTRTMDMLNTQQYIAMRQEAFANDGVDTYPDYAYDVNGTWSQTRYTDWQKELIGGTAFTRTVDAAISGGNSNTSFTIRGANFHETTVFPGNFAYNKASAHFSVTHRSTDEKFNISLSGNYVADKNNLLAMDLTREALILPPNAPALYNEQGELNWENSTWENPLRLLNEKYNAKTNTLTAGGVLGYKLLASLELRTNFGYTDMRVKESRIVPSTIYDPAFGLNSSVSYVMLNNANQQSWSIEPQMNWQRDICSGALSVLTGATFQQRTAEQFGLFGGGFASNTQLNNIAAASQLVVLNNDISTYRYNAIFGRINYNLADKYFINLTGRRDGSSRFGPGKRFTNFGAVGAAWLFGKERWFENLPLLSYGKLRGSYGTTGNDQIGDYQFLETYLPSGYNYDGIVGLQPARLFNPDFSWETNRKLEVALELGFFADRLLVTAAHYRNHSSNQLVGVPLPGTTGFPSIQANLGATVQNTGWEFELRTVNAQQKDFRWSTGFNITAARNKLLEFPGLEGSPYAAEFVIGQPLDLRLVYNYTGIDPETGTYTFTDYNGDGVISPADDRKKAVSLAPDFFGGLQNSLSYKNWQLDFLFQFVKQKGINYLNTAALPGTAANQPVEVLDHWQPGQDGGQVQVYTAGFNNDAATAFYNYASSDAAFTDASFIRLKNLSLSYTLPRSWAGKNTCRIYFQGQNLLTFTRFLGPDPENQVQFRLPPLKVLSAGIQINL
jgi:TonB-linked SusC/RagA family outer membrane protein